MREFQIRLSTMADVKTFVEEASAMDADVDVISGRYTVDAKSILGVCSLDLQQPLTIRAYGDEAAAERFEEAVRPFVIA